MPTIPAIKSIFSRQSNYAIQFLWIPSDIDIHGNKVADHLTKSLSNLISPSFIQHPWTDVTL